MRGLKNKGALRRAHRPAFDSKWAIPRFRDPAGVPLRQTVKIWPRCQLFRRGAQSTLFWAY